MEKCVKWFSLMAICIVVVGCHKSQTLQLAPHSDVLIKNVTTIDAVNGVRLGQNVAITADQISAVGDAESMTAKSVVDGSGKYLIPGLWDAHVHLSFEPDLDSAMFNLLIANGITSVRDTGGELDKVVAWKEKSKTRLAPDVYIAGPLIDGEPGVYLGKVKGFPKIGIEVRTEAMVVETVDSLVAAGVDLLKAYEMLSPAVYKALLKRAKHHGLPVTGHVPLSMSAQEVSEAGLSSMEHLRNLEMDCSTESEALLEQRVAMLKNEQEKPGSTLRSEIHKAQHYSAAVSYDEERCAKLISVLAENQTWQIPTLTLMMASRVPFYVQDEWRETFRHLPEPIKSDWLNSTQRFKKALTVANEARQNRQRVADWKIRMVKELSDAGVPMMAGTDMPLFYLTPGFSLHKELESLVLAGLTPMQALETATINPAKYFNKQSLLGSIDVGKTADLVLLSKDPMLDIRNTQSIDAVIRQGQMLDRTRLDQMLEASSR